MAYKGKTITVSCNRGGLTGAKNIDDIPNYMMTDGTRNIVFEKGGRRKRGGTAHLNVSAYTGTPVIIGLKHVAFEDSTSFLLAATDDGDIYKNDTDKINASALGTTHPYSMEMGENKVFIADGVNVPVVWTGTGNAAAIHEPATDFSTFPVFQFLKHTRGLSERMCALNYRGLFLSKSYTSALDMEHFITGAMYFHIDPGDGQGLTGAIEIGSEVVVFGKRKAYRLDDTSLDTANWGLNGAQWEGGVASWRLLVKIPNGDVLAMMDDGEIYSVSAAETYGDYKSASITRPSWMHDWIKDNVDLAKILTFHSRFDNELRAVRFFVAKKGANTPNACLLYYVDRPKEEAWMLEDNPAAASGYDATASCDGPSTAGGYVFYTGDNVGNIWKLNQTDRNDNSNGYPAGFKTTRDCSDAPQIKKHFNSGGVIAEAKGDYDLQVRIYIDDVLLNKNVGVNMSGGGVMLDAFVLDTDTLGDVVVIDVPFGIGKIGTRIQYQFYNNEADQDFFISSYSTDLKPMGRASQGGDQ
jgi:hypothetical protein